MDRYDCRHHTVDTHRYARYYYRCCYRHRCVQIPLAPHWTPTSTPDSEILPLLARLWTDTTTGATLWTPTRVTVPRTLARTPGGPRRGTAFPSGAADSCCRRRNPGRGRQGVAVSRGPSRRGSARRPWGRRLRRPREPVDSEEGEGPRGAGRGRRPRRRGPGRRHWPLSHTAVTASRCAPPGAGRVR